MSYKRPAYTSLLILAIYISPLFSCAEGYSSEINGIIKSFCLEAFKQEVVNSESNFNIKTGEFTCNCFVNRVNEGFTMDLARQTCKEDASRKFKF